MERHQWDNYAQEYHTHIISPLRERVRNPLYADLLKIPSPERLTVADIGTGRGDLIPRLAQRFGHVVAIDFSRKMLDEARRLQGARRNVSFVQHDTRELARSGLTFDVAIAVNSVLHPCSRDVNASLSQIHASLREGGVFLGIFPAMEAVLYYFTLVYERELARHPDEKAALRSACRIAQRNRYDIMGGVYDDGERQKLYYEFELRARLADAGFRNVVIKRVRYAWKDVESYEDFSGRPELWDWYVRARKPSA